ncbi:DMT family transporter [Paludibacterium paludis]|nr:DMT family transporter [Paludibacterium paludis]
MFWALLNGMVIALGRAVNGRLSLSAGPFRASLWNHWVGFLLLSLMLMVLGRPDAGLAPRNLDAYLGGVFGALFVAVNSFVFTRLGAMRASLLVIGGQMLFAVLLDWRHQQQAPDLIRCLGVLMLLLGMYLSGVAKQRRAVMKPGVTAVGSGG